MVGVTTVSTFSAESKHLSSSWLPHERYGNETVNSIICALFYLRQPVISGFFFLKKKKCRAHRTGIQRLGRCGQFDIILVVMEFRTSWFFLKCTLWRLTKNEPTVVLLFTAMNVRIHSWISRSFSKDKVWRYTQWRREVSGIGCRRLSIEIVRTTIYARRRLELSSFAGILFIFIS